MERIFLVIFILLISGFIFWYQKNMEHINKYITKQQKKEIKKNRKNRKNRKNKKNKKVTIKQNIELESDSDTDSKIRVRKSSAIKPYEEKYFNNDNESMDSLSMDSNAESINDEISLDSASTDDFLSYK